MNDIGQHNKDAPTTGEREPLLKRTPGADGQDGEPGASVSTGVAGKLYVSHFLSTWNSRVFEFGAVLYLATIYPGTLLPMSVYAFTRGLCAVVFATAVGQYIDTGNRLNVVRLSIVAQRLVVAASCALFYVLLTQPSLDHKVKTGMLAVLAFLACLEKLCSIMNLVAVEKDWVVVVAQKDESALRDMNAKMRRIDLVCKLMGPLFIALIDGASTKIAIIVNFAMNLSSIPVEYFAIARVYYEVDALQQPKRSQDNQDTEHTHHLNGRFKHFLAHIQQAAKKWASDFGMYFSHRAFLPSIAGALLYLTVLNFAGQMVTYLLSAGYTSTQIGVARTLSVMFEILATWIAPWLIGKIGPVRAGLWLSAWQVTMLATGTVLFFVYYVDKPVLSASGLVGGTILSRVGLRGFDLCAQLLVQEDVEAQSRGAFSSVEAAWQSVFELLSYASTMVFFRGEQFKWPALISVIAVALASSAYTLYVRLRRGHLVHFDIVKRVLNSKNGKRRERERLIERIASN